MLAAMHGNIACVEKLLQAGANVMFFNLVNLILWWREWIWKLNRAIFRCWCLTPFPGEPAYTTRLTTAILLALRLFFLLLNLVQWLLLGLFALLTIDFDVIVVSFRYLVILNWFQGVCAVCEY